MAALRKLWGLRRQRPVFVATSFAVLAFLVTYPALHWWLQTRGITGAFRYYDLGAYRAAVGAWQAGEPIYVQNEGGGYHGSYLYPPVYLLLFLPVADVPFADLTFHQAGTLLNVVSLGLLWLGLQAATAGYDLRLAWIDRLVLLWAVAGFAPVVISMRLAQVSVFLAALLSFALAGIAYAEGDGDRGVVLDYASGALTTVAGTLKLIYAPGGAHLLVDRRRFAAAVATGVGLLVVSLAVFGVEAHVRYYDVLTWGKGWGESRAPFPPGLWLPPYYRPFYYLGSTVGMAIRVALAAGISILAVRSTGEGVDDVTFALGVAAIPLVAPRAYTQDLAVLLPVVIALLATELRREDGYPLVPVVGLFLAAIHPSGLFGIIHLAAALFPASSYDAIGSLVGLLQPGVWAALLLVGLAAVRVAEAATLPARLPGR
jgi:hypothetical protein